MYKKYMNQYFKPNRWEDLTGDKKGMDNPYVQSYNNSSEATSYDPDDAWKKSNEKELRYAGDRARESIDEGLDYVPKFMKGAPKGTDYGKVQTAAVKWQLAHDANNKELSQSAFDELTGLLSTENKEAYLKKARPLQEFIDAKDTFDYQRKNYTTTKNSTQRFDQAIQNMQRILNEKGYTDKFGEKLKEDGIYGAKTRFAEDGYKNSIEDFDFDKNYDGFNPKTKTNSVSSNLVYYSNSQNQPKTTKPGLSNFIYKTQYPDFDTIKSKYGKDVANTALEHAIASYHKAQTYMNNNNIKGDAENVVDAYRHFIWNVALTRDIGIDKAKYITNLHEYLDIKNNDWLKSGDIDKGNLIRGQMNQSMLMDLWNNSVARALCSDKSYRNKSVDELFEIAMKNNKIIEDVNEVYDFLGIKHCADQHTYTVNVMWDITTGNITVYDINGKEFMTLKIGV